METREIDYEAYRHTCASDGTRWIISRQPVPEYGNSTEYRRLVEPLDCFPAIFDRSGLTRIPPRLDCTFNRYVNEQGLIVDCAKFYAIMNDERLRSPTPYNSWIRAERHLLIK